MGTVPSWGLGTQAVCVCQSGNISGQHPQPSRCLTPLAVSKESVGYIKPSSLKMARLEHGSHQEESVMLCIYSRNELILVAD